jgi:Flp pilus assembly protein TadD
VITFFMLVLLGISPQSKAIPPQSSAVTSEQLLAWQLAGLTREELLAELETRGLQSRPSDDTMDALTPAGAEPATIKAIERASQAANIWQLRWKPSATVLLLQEVAHQIYENEREAAEAMLREELRKRPGNAELHLVLAHLLCEDEYWVEAYAEARQAVALAPLSPYARGQLSFICSRARLGGSASKHAREMLELRPHDAVAYGLLGLSLNSEGNYTEAIQAFDNALKLKPDYAAAFSGSGTAYRRTGDYKRSIEAFERAIQLEPKQFLYFCELGDTYYLSGNLGKAIHAYKDAEGLAPDRPDIRQNLGNLYLQGHRYEDAVREFREMLAKSPEWDLARPGLAAALRGLGRTAEAAQVYAEPLEPPEAAAPR